MGSKSHVGRNCQRESVPHRNNSAKEIRSFAQPIVSEFPRVFVLKERLDFGLFFLACSWDEQADFMKSWDSFNEEFHEGHQEICLNGSLGPGQCRESTQRCQSDYFFLVVL